MTQAQIRINQPANPNPAGQPGRARDDLRLGAAVELRNVDNNGVQRWFWAMLDKPPGSSATIANPTSAVATFTPDVVGTYRVYLRVNDGRGRRGMEDTTTAIVRDVAGFRPPAYLEGVESDFDIAPGVPNEVGWLHEARLRMFASDNRSGAPETASGVAGGGGVAVVRVPWPLHDAEMVILEIVGSSSTNTRVAVYPDDAMVNASYRSIAFDSTLTWAERAHYTITGSYSNGIESNFIKIVITNNDVGASDYDVRWRFQAL